MLVLLFVAMLGGYFIYAKRRLQHAHRLRFDADHDGLQAFYDVDSADVDALDQESSTSNNNNNNNNNRNNSSRAMNITHNPLIVSSSLPTPLLASPSGEKNNSNDNNIDGEMTTRTLVHTQQETLI